MRNARRAGFTLVELMVAMALTLFVMVILSQAFVSALDTFSAMKGIGDMQVNLRTAGNILRSDLSQDHFEGKRRLSDLTAPGGTPLIVSQPLQAGFFAVMQESAVGSANYVYEGADANGLPSYRAVDHVLYMTVKRRGNRQENFFTASLQDTSATGLNLTAFFGKATAYDLDPAAQLPFYTWTPPYVSGSASGSYSSQWAEVVYFLVPTGSTEEPNNPGSKIGTPTYGLFRAQFVMVPDGTNVNTLGLSPLLGQTVFAGMSTTAGTTLQFNSPATAATGQRVIPTLTPLAFSTLLASDARFQTGDASGATLSYSANLVLPNVLSFQVQTMPTGYTAFTDGSFDTVTPTTGLQAIQITLRVFDNASRQARQMTIVQDL